MVCHKECDEMDDMVYDLRVQKKRGVTRLWWGSDFGFCVLGERYFGSDRVKSGFKSKNP